ncbi:TPA: hypothetical protein N0F65_002135 [Lagenidium giganteum]|uniref:Uncharacterized protein n=1 Tax=Lagenidium giganteum TaxID=4803 RepID=A0AAV2ZBK1_9STRA|nr:TPA: hypothetical protein N0F65_002135 [Lagenidium giganteum]
MRGGGESAASASYATPGRDQRSGSIATPSTIGKTPASKYGGEPSPQLMGSVLDQLHAEQRSTIEALTCQVEFYRQREERYKKEMETLRSYARDASGDNERAEMVVKLAAETRSLEEELYALRNKESVVDVEKQDAEARVQHLEFQLNEARGNLARFTKAIEQLELKVQRKDAENQTHGLQLEQELRLKAQTCESLQRELDRVNLQLDNLQTVNLENQRLRSEMQARDTRDAHKETAASMLSEQIEAVKKELEHVKQQKNEFQTTALELQTKLAEAAKDQAAAWLEVEKKKVEIKDLQMRAENSSSMLALREQQSQTEGDRRQQEETERQRLLDIIATLQREKDQAGHQLFDVQSQLDTTTAELKAARTRLLSKDSSVIVSTLKAEITSLKERVRQDIKVETQALRSQKEALEKENMQLHGRCRERDSTIHRLQQNISQFQESIRQSKLDASNLQEQNKRLQVALESAHAQYQQLQDCRSTLADKLDQGLKELLGDDDDVESALREAADLRHELASLKQRNASLEAELGYVRQDAERIQHQARQTAEHVQTKVEALYQEIQDKDRQLMAEKHKALDLQLLEQEKSTWERQVEAIQRSHESREEVLRAEIALRDREVEALKDVEAELRETIATLERTRQEQQHTTDAIAASERHATAEMQSVMKEQERLNAKIEELQQSLEQERAAVAQGKRDKSARERKLLQERKQLENELKKLVERIERASAHNEQLGEQVAKYVRQSRKDHAEIIALETQIKAYRHKIRALEEQLQRGTDQLTHHDDDMGQIQQQLREMTCLRDSYQVELRKLRDALKNAERERDSHQQQRDSAAKRLKMLLRCQEQMKAAAEEHTTALASEIDTMQRQLEQERQRCSGLLSNEKALLRDLQERNASIQKLQQALTLAHQQQQQSRAAAATPPVPQPAQAGRTATPRKVSAPVSLLTPAKELDRLLSNLERISEYSSQHPVAAAPAP